MKDEQIINSIASCDKMYTTEDQCRQLLVDLKWNGTRTCDRCGNHDKNYYLATRNIWKCSSCSRQFSVKKGTIFESSKLPFKTWFKAIFILATHDSKVSSCQLAELLDVQQRTAWFMKQRICKDLTIEDQMLIGTIIGGEKSPLSSPLV